MRPFAPLPAAPSGPYQGSQLPPSEWQLAQRELASAEAGLVELMHALMAARAGIGKANRTHTAAVMSANRVLMPAQRYSPERLRERKSYAFRLVNQRRSQVAAARRRVETARVALGLPTLASVEERTATREAIRTGKRKARRSGVSR